MLSNTACEKKDWRWRERPTLPKASRSDTLAEAPVLSAHAHPIRISTRAQFNRAHRAEPFKHHAAS
jgi:hypothetical protein